MSARSLPIGLCVAAAVLLHALTGGSARAGEPAQRIEAAFAMRPPVVDGSIGEKEWSGAHPAAFGRGGPPPRCTVRLLWAKEGLFLAARISESTPVFGQSPAGGSLHEEDVFELFIDPIGDHRQYYEIQFDPGGRSFFKNYLLTAPPVSNATGRLTPAFTRRNLWGVPLPSPPGLRAASKLDPVAHSWSLEAFLPASFLDRRRNGGPLEPGTWRVNFARYDWDAPLNVPGRKVEQIYWSPVAPGCPQISPEAMGFLDLLPRAKAAHPSAGVAR